MLVVQPLHIILFSGRSLSLYGTKEAPLLQESSVISVLGLSERTKKKITLIPNVDIISAYVGSKTKGRPPHLVTMSGLRKMIEKASQSTQMQSMCSELLASIDRYVKGEPAIVNVTPTSIKSNNTTTVPATQPATKSPTTTKTVTPSTNSTYSNSTYVDPVPNRITITMDHISCDDNSLDEDGIEEFEESFIRTKKHNMGRDIARKAVSIAPTRIELSIRPFINPSSQQSYSLANLPSKEILNTHLNTIPDTTGPCLYLIHVRADVYKCDITTEPLRLQLFKIMCELNKNDITPTFIVAYQFESLKRAKAVRSLLRTSYYHPADPSMYHIGKVFTTDEIYRFQQQMKSQTLSSITQYEESKIDINVKHRRYARDAKNARQRTK